MAKIAIDAGHGLKTAGKRCLKSLDKNETREWVLNDRASEVVGNAIVAMTEENSILTVRNPAGNAAALTVTPVAGGTRSVSAHLLIVQLQ